MSETCGAPHPEDETRTCISKSATHGFHVDGQGEPWPRTERIEQVKSLVAARRSNKRGKRGIKKQILDGARGGKAALLEQDVEEAVAAQSRPTWGPPPPIVGTDDPETSKEAAERYEPKRDTAKGRVLVYLQARIGQWVDAPELTTEAVGGFAGTRRLRELREQGWPIDTRPKPGAENTWQHRLVPEEEWTGTP